MRTERERLGEAVIQLHNIARFVETFDFDKTVASDIRAVADKLNKAEPVPKEEEE